MSSFICDLYRNSEQMCSKKVDVNKWCEPEPMTFESISIFFKMADILVDKQGLSNGGFTRNTCCTFVNDLFTGDSDTWKYKTLQ